MADGDDILRGTFGELRDSMDPKDRPIPRMPAAPNLRHSLRTLFRTGGMKGLTDEIGSLMSQMNSIVLAKTQEEWDGGNLSVKYLDVDGNVTGAAVDLPVLMNGPQSRPYIKTGDIVHVLTIATVATIVVQGDSDPVGSYKEGYWPKDVALASNADDQSAATGPFRWWRIVAGNVGNAISVPNPTADTLNGYTTILDGQGRVVFQYKSDDADFKTVDGAGRVGQLIREATAGTLTKTHDHDPHTLAFESEEFSGLLTGFAGAQVGLSVAHGDADGAHVHAGIASSTNISHDHELGYAAAIFAKPGVSGEVAVPDSVKTKSLSTGDIEVNVGEDGNHQHSNMTVTTADHRHTYGFTVTPALATDGTNLTHNQADHINPGLVAMRLIKVA